MQSMFHSIRSITKTVVCAGIAGIVVSIPASAITILSPTEGQTVRDQVKIVVPKSSVPLNVLSGGFLSVRIDGKLRAAVSTQEESKKGKGDTSPNVVFIWDSKAIMDPTLPGSDKQYPDGRHEITVEGHGIQGSNSKETIVESAKVNVVLHNTVDRPKPAPPIKLRYRYTLGQSNIINCAVTGDILDNNGYNLTGGQPPIQAEFDVAQSVEDIESDGAMLRYKVQPNAFAQIFGQVNLMGGTASPFRSLYKVINATGRTVAANVLSTKNDVEVTDCLLPLPTRSVQVGESWPTMFNLRLEGISDIARFSGTSTLEGLEWERGLPCAKIVSKLTGSPTFKFLPKQVGSVSAVSTAYFAYGKGKLIKNTIVMTFNTTMDVNQLNSYIQQSASAAGTGVPGGAPVVPTPSSVVMPGMGSYAGVNGGSAGGTTASLTPVKFKIVVIQKLTK